MTLAALHRGAQHLLQRGECFVLKNGLRVVLLQDNRLPLVAIQLCYLAGAAQDPADGSGLAHLCEHLAFRQSVGQVDLPTGVQQRGGDSNASTTYEWTRFSSLLPSSELAFGLWSEGQRLQALAQAPTDQAVDSERQVLLQELKQKANRPGNAVLGAQHALLFPKTHPYHRLPAGSIDGLQAVDAKEAGNFFDQYYRPSNAVLVVAGDFLFGEAARWIENSLGDGPAGSPRPAWEPTELAPLSPGKRQVLIDRGPNAKVTLTFRAPGFGTREGYAAALFSWGLGVDPMSPLKRSLMVEEKLCQQVKSTLITMRGTSSLAFEATALPNGDVKELEAALKQACARIFAEGLDPELLARTQKKMIKVHYFRMQELSSRAAFCARWTSTFGRPEHLTDEAERYLEIQPADLRQMAAELGHGVVVITLPQGDQR